MPTASRFSAVPETIWSARKRDREQRVQRGEDRARGDRDHDAQEPRAGDVRAPGAEERADQHHALERDVDDAGALGEQPAERAEASAAWRSAASRPAARPRRRPPRGCSRPTASPRSRRRCRSRPRRSAPQPSRFSPPRDGDAPAADRRAARRARSATGERTMIGGTATKNARKPRATPPQPMLLAPRVMPATAASGAAARRLRRSRHR